MIRTYIDEEDTFLKLKRIPLEQLENEFNGPIGKNWQSFLKKHGYTYSEWFHDWNRRNPHTFPTSK